MIKVRNYFIPLPGYKCMTIWPFVFIRILSGVNGQYNDVDATHEGIHGEQQKETLVFLFLVWYVFEWIVRLVIYRNQAEAYRNISFEQEAFMYQSDMTYLNERKRYAWVRFIFKKTYSRKK